ncbi:type II secretion system protein [Spiribacter sp. 1M153]|uniref:type II secretion system protein J n=1 Tax=Spiribacter roseus TaxID=1855875 RepID=UPI00349F731E
MVVPRRNAQPRDTQRGITLIEMIITITVLGIIGGFISQPLLTLLQNQQTVTTQSDQAEELEYALSRMAGDVRFAKTSIVCSGNSLSIGNPATTYRYDAGSNALFVDQRNPTRSEILVSNVTDFTCERVRTDLALFDLDLTVDNDHYNIRVLTR